VPLLGRVDVIFQVDRGARIFGLSVSGWWSIPARWVMEEWHSVPLFVFDGGGAVVPRYRVPSAERTEGVEGPAFFPSSLQSLAG
jgi:hypothetical protein